MARNGKGQRSAQTVIEHVIKGAKTQAEAARLLGVHRSTLHRWANKVEQGSPPSDFRSDPEWQKQRRERSARQRREVGGPRDPRWLLYGR